MHSRIIISCLRWLVSILAFLREPPLVVSSFLTNTPIDVSEKDSKIDSIPIVFLDLLSYSTKCLSTKCTIDEYDTAVSIVIKLCNTERVRVNIN